MSNYSELLKDPRWQKKRLEIFQRDDFTCQECFSTNKTLHVHHIKYVGDFPWETPDLYLLTLCEDCHRLEEEVKQEDLLLALDNCGLTREAIKRIIEHIAFVVWKNAPNYRSPFWAVHNHVLKQLLPDVDLDELIAFRRHGIIPPPHVLQDGEEIY